MEKVDIYKKTIGEFIFAEFIVFVSQIMVFFAVAYLSSGLLTDEVRLERVAEQRINDDSLEQMWFTFLGIIFVTGVFAIIGRVTSNRLIDPYIHEVLYQMPKTVYVFGSSGTGIMIAVIVFLHLNPDPGSSTKLSGFAWVTMFFSLVMFLFGCMLSYAFKRKSHIK